MRTYGQYCAVAKALDLLGDRWTLLLVRELLLRGPCRYTDLREGLPGIATNLLAERLRELDEAGVVSREEAPPPVATALFKLTARGEELAPVLHELLRWGMPLMEQGPTAEDVFRARWMTWPAEMSLADREPGAPPVAIQVLTDEQPLLVEAAGGEVRVEPGTVEDPALTVSGPLRAVAGLLTGRIDVDTAVAIGLELHGDEAALERVLPDAPAAQAPAAS